LLPSLKSRSKEKNWVMMDINTFWITGPFRLFADPNYNGGFFTLTNIPPYAISNVVAV
jgi:hypothetical protein